MGQEDDFIQRTKFANNYYCPDGNYKGIKLRLQQSRQYEDSYNFQIK